MNYSLSQFSNLDAMSSVSRRSNLTMITLQSGLTGATGRSKALPKEARLRDNALRRMSEAQLKEIENHLRKIRNTNDLSYSNTKQGESDPAADKGGIDTETLMRLIDECKEEEDRIGLISAEEEDDNLRQQLENQR